MRLWVVEMRVRRGFDPGEPWCKWMPVAIEAYAYWFRPRAWKKARELRATERARHVTGPKIQEYRVKPWVRER